MSVTLTPVTASGPTMVPMIFMISGVAGKRRQSLELSEGVRSDGRAVDSTTSTRWDGDACACRPRNGGRRGQAHDQYRGQDQADYARSQRKDTSYHLSLRTGSHRLWDSRSRAPSTFAELLDPKTGRARAEEAGMREGTRRAIPHAERPLTWARSPFRTGRRRRFQRHPAGTGSVGNCP